MKSKKLLSVLATSLLIVGMASCGGGETSGGDQSTTNGGTSDNTTTGTSDTDTGTSSTTPTGGFIKEPVEIQFWNTKGSPYQEEIIKAIETFKTVEPNVTVTNVKQSVGISGLQDVVTKGFSTNVYPDIVEGYPDHVSTYLDYQKVVNLDKYIDDPEIGWTSEEKADIVTTYMQEGQEYIEEGTYSLPFSKSTEVLLYNKTMLNNLDLSSVDSSINNGRPLNDRYFQNLTWEEFFGKLCPAIMEYNETLPEAEKLLDTKNNAKYALLGYDSDDNLAITLSQQYGMPYTSLDRESGVGKALFNTEEMKDKIEWIYNMAKNKYIITQGGLGTYTNSLLETNGVLFLVSSTGGLSHCTVQGIEIGAGLIPQPEVGNSKVISQGPSICLLEHTGDKAELRQQASWLFYKHLTNFNNGLSWALNGGYSPIRYSVLESEEYLNAMDPDSAGAVDSLQHLQAVVNTVVAKENFQSSLYTTPAFKGSAQARSNLGGVITKVVGAAYDASQPALTREQISAWLKEAYDQTVIAINS